MPSLLFFVWTMFDNFGTKTRLIVFFILYSIPSLIFIDHGHFQPNQVMLGLVILGITFMLRNNTVMAVVAMTLAVNFKITACYYLLPFGVFALAQVIKKSKDQNASKMFLKVL